jgi:hypothetical protein
MCGGGGDPGADARTAETQRQGRIQAATDEINRIFSGAVKSQGTRTIPGAQLTPGALASGGGLPMAAGTGTPGGLAAYYDQDRFMSPDQAVAAGGYTSGANGTPATFAPDTTQNFDIWTPPAGGNPREALYADQRNSIYDLNSAEVNRQAANAQRQNNFALARAGQSTGSNAISSNAELNRRTNEGLLRAGGIADQSSADLRTADERTRSNLISMAQSGVDTGSAATMALGGLQANANSVAGQRSGATIGTLFDDISNAYLVNQQAQGRNAGMYGQQFYGVSDPRKGASGTLGR